MDRRHLVLAIAVGAAIATSWDPDSFAFQGSQSVTLDLQLEGQETRSWAITSEVTLPPEAEGEPYDSLLSVLVNVSGSEGLQRVALMLRDCDDGAVLAQTVLADQPGGGSWIGGQLDVPDLFGDCPIDDACVRTACLDVTNDTTSPAQVDLEINAWLTSDAYGQDEPGLGVDLQLTVQEIEP